MECGVHDLLGGDSGDGVPVVIPLRDGGCRGGPLEARNDPERP